jgi:hypothetical protein
MMSNDWLPGPRADVLAWYTTLLAWSILGKFIVGRTESLGLLTSIFHYSLVLLTNFEGVV